MSSDSIGTTRMRSWIQDPLDVCVTYQSNKNLIEHDSHSTQSKPSLLLKEHLQFFYVLKTKFTRLGVFMTLKIQPLWFIGYMNHA